MLFRSKEGTESHFKKGPSNSSTDTGRIAKDGRGSAIEATRGWAPPPELLAPQSPPSQHQHRGGPGSTSKAKWMRGLPAPTRSKPKQPIATDERPLLLLAAKCGSPAMPPEQLRGGRHTVSYRSRKADTQPATGGRDDSRKECRSRQANKRPAAASDEDGWGDQWPGAPEQRATTTDT